VPFEDALSATPGVASQARTALLGLVLSSALLAGLFGALWLDHRQKLRSAEARVAAITRGSERALELELRNLERALQGIATDAANLQAQVPAQAQAQRLALVQGVDARHEELRAVRLLDAAGRPLDDAFAGDPAVARWADDPVHRSGRGVLRVGTPRQLAGGRWVLPLAVPAVLPGHARPGWVVASLDVAALAEFAHGLDTGPEGVANVFHRNGRMLARSRTHQRTIGEDFSRSPLLRMALIRPAGTADLVSRVDGTRRLLAWRALADYPLVVTAGMSRRAVLGTWYAFAAAAALACIAYLLGWLMLARTLLRANRRQQSLLGRLAASRATLLESQRIAGLGSFRIDLASERLEFSPVARSIYGYAPEEPVDVAGALQRTHPDDADRIASEHARHIAERDFPDTRYRVLRPDGSERTVIARGHFTWVDGREFMIGTLQDITDLARALERLRETEAQYRLLFERNPLPFWVVHRGDFRIMEANQAALAQYGYSRDEFLALHLRDLRPPEDVEEAERAAREDYPETGSGRVWRHLCKDGRLLQVAIHASDIRFRGEPARLVLAMDVTHRLQAQQRLEESERRFQLVARATSDAVFDWNIVTGSSWRSRSFSGLFGYAEGEMPETIDAWHERVHPDDVARVDAELHRVFYLTRDSEWSTTYRFRRGDGGYAWVHDRGLLERDERGKPLRMVGGMVDVTRRHEDEAELRLLRRAIESTENGIAIADARSPELPLVYVNAAFEQITGYPASEALGRNCRFLQGEDRRQDGVDELAAALRGGHEARALLRNYRRSGELFYNQLSLSPVRDDAGAVTHYVGVLNDVSERQRHEAELAFRATHDELTGLLNRGALLAGLEHRIAAHPDAPLSVLYLDFNNFKLINDSLGHEVGDAVLQVVARRLRELAGADRIGRMGGNEFMVVVADADADTAIGALLESLSQPIEVLSTLHYLGVNAGIARYPAHGDSPDQLLRNAGLATHESRRRGQNQRVEYRAEFDRHVTDRQALVSALHEALEREQFEVHFQPQYDSERAPTGLEALVRWRHPERGLVSPAEFIPVAEDSGLIVPLGRWVLREACRHHRALAEAGLGHLTLAVNVSAMQFLSGELQHDVPALLREFGVPQGILELELTESLVMENPEPVIQVMQSLRQHGVQLSIDDFGTGYSSMAYLHRLPVDKLKIDRSFVAGVEADPHNAAICESILALARTFGLKVIAEGVETQAQFDWLREHHCDEVQGYLLARPMPFPQVVATLTMANGCLAPAR
jgi:diguanylate cyclase (GGDEF)-like protein/PAS domain S-box-containing protein